MIDFEKQRDEAAEKKCPNIVRSYPEGYFSDEPTKGVFKNGFKAGADWALKYFREHYNFSYEMKPTATTACICGEINARNCPAHQGVKDE